MSVYIHVYVHAWHYNQLIAAYNNATVHPANINLISSVKFNFILVTCAKNWPQCIMVKTI